MKQHLAGVSKRQQEIMEALRQQGVVAVDSLAKAMNVAHAEHTGDGS
jgi:DeoR/GlpR family transcriptional regulator of sugar metabolism